MLTKLAALVMDQMELRLSARKVSELEQAERRISEQTASGERSPGAERGAVPRSFRRGPDRLRGMKGWILVSIRANRTGDEDPRPQARKRSPGHLGRLSCPTPPTAQRRLSEALDSIGTHRHQRGRARTAPQGRRQSQCGSSGGPGRPLAAIAHETMFVDITERRADGAGAAAAPGSKNAYLCEEIRSEHQLR